MRRSLISLATCLLISPALVAQDSPNQPKVIPPGVVRVEGEVRPMFQVLTSRRARLGISVNLRARDTDSIGALVSSVTPNGPAAKAGLRSGDVITKLAGTSLLEGQTRAGNDASAPGLRLTELAARLDPDDTIAVEFRRGKERKTVSLITGDEPTIMWRTPDGGFGYAMGDEPFRQYQDAMRGSDPEDSQPRYPMRMMHPDAPMRFAWGSPLADLELAPLNPDLGRYFGTSEGILVISVPADSKLGLRGGDVVLAVDGREPANASHLLRILRSYEGTESFKLDIMRDKKRMTVIGKIGMP